MKGFFLTLLTWEDNQTIRDGSVQLGLFDERNIFELTHPEYPGERLVACRNPEMARRRKENRPNL